MRPPTLVDTHCHLDLADYDADREAVLERAAAAGVRAVVNPSIGRGNMDRVVALARERPMIHAAVGVHPHSARDVDADCLAAIRAHATGSRPRVVAIGEIGLDYFPRYLEQTPAAIQKPAFEAQLALAAELGLPIIVHCRDAFADTLAMVEPWAGRIRGVFHCFGGEAADAARALEYGFHVSFTGPLTFKNAVGLRAVAATVPPGRTILETDGPYLAPHPHRGKRNEPAFVAHTAGALAELHGLSLAELAEKTTANAKDLFGIET